MRIRLQDVAVRAGVSEATVSRVINGKTGVADATRAHVVSVLAELGYVPTELRPTPRAGAIGLIVPELDNPVFPAFAQAIEARLRASGYLSILCCASRAGASEGEYVETLLGRGVDGMVIVSGRHADAAADHGMYAELVDDGVPLVIVNGQIDVASVPSVSSDDHSATVMAYEYLRALGHVHIGLLTGPVQYVPVVRKMAGFRAAAVDADVGPADVDRFVAESIFTVEGGCAGAEELLSVGVTGIIAASDMMALGAIRAARGRGLHVPDDVSVIGYDDTELMRFTDPPLTTVRQPVEQIADRATTILLAQVDGRPYESREYLVDCELIGRASTARCANIVHSG